MQHNVFQMVEPTSTQNFQDFKVEPCTDLRRARTATRKQHTSHPQIRGRCASLFDACWGRFGGWRIDITIRVGDALEKLTKLLRIDPIVGDKQMHVGRDVGGHFGAFWARFGRVAAGLMGSWRRWGGLMTIIGTLRKVPSLNQVRHMCRIWARGVLHLECAREAPPGSVDGTVCREMSGLPDGARFWDVGFHHDITKTDLHSSHVFLIPPSRWRAGFRTIRTVEASDTDGMFELSEAQDKVQTAGENLTKTLQYEEVRSEPIACEIPASTSSDWRGHQATPLLPYTGPPTFNQPPPYADQARLDRSVALAYMAQVQPPGGSSNQGPADARYSDSSLAGWAGPMSMSHPRSNTASALQSSYTKAHSQRQSPPFSSAPVRPRYDLSVHQGAFGRTSSTPAPAPAYPQGDLCDPDSVADSARMPDPSLS
ncbi:hypothetical protein FB451DRAFT_1185808 [Mycena latifolia]|nr:hypothetical protein FB451DRAFT_1185808 [Mycena latifolia]